MKLLDETEKLQKTIEKLRYENTQLRSLNKSLFTKTGLTFESTVSNLKEFLQQESSKVFKVRFPKPVEHRPIKKSVFDKDHNETATLVLSDWHLGEQISPLEINGMNKFNPLILANRAWELTTDAMKIIRGHQTMYGIDKLWLPVLGDMISGSIHPELILTNSLLDYPSTVLAARLLILVVERLKTLGLPIELDMIVGNHARQLAKITTKKQAHLSLDWVCYTMVEEHFRNDVQVKTYVHASQFALVTQRGLRFVLDHGSGYPNAKMDEIQSRIRGIFDSPTYRDATGFSGPSVDFVILGDKHRRQRGPGWLVNGCAVGASEITTSWRLTPIRAEQSLFGISNKRPVTFEYALDLTDNISEETNNPFAKYTAEFMERHGR